MLITNVMVTKHSLIITLLTLTIKLQEQLTVTTNRQIWKKANKKTKNKLILIISKVKCLERVPCLICSANIIFIKTKRSISF